MLDDSDQLQRDLDFDPRHVVRFWGSGRSSAIQAFTLTYTLLLWAWTIGEGSPGGWARGASGLGACAVFVVLGLEIAVATVLGQATWRFLGPAGRTVLRPFMVLGFFPPLVVFFVSSLALIGLILNLTGNGPPGTGFFHRAPTSGANWSLFELSPAERDGVAYDQAIVRCLELGDGWQVPAPANIPALNPPFEGRKRERFWFTGPERGSAPLLGWNDCKPRGCALAFQLGQEGATGQVLCVRP